MTEDNKTNTPTKVALGVLGRAFAKHEQGAPAAGSAPPAVGPVLPLADIQGFILRGYRMPMVRHFLLTVSAPGAARKLLGRLVSGDESDAPQITTGRRLARGLCTGTRRQSRRGAAAQAPNLCLNVGITWPGMIALELRDRVPALAFEFVQCVHGRCRRTSEVSGGYWSKRPRKLGWRVREGKRPCPGDPACPQLRFAEVLWRPAL